MTMYKDSDLIAASIYASRRQCHQRQGSNYQTATTVLNSTLPQSHNPQMADQESALQYQYVPTSCTATV